MARKRGYQKLKANSWWRRQWRYFFLRLLRLRGKPRAIARGLAIGVFSGCFPLFGLQIIMGVLLAAIFRSNKIAAVAGTWISNPFTYVPIFAFNFQVGKLILGNYDLAFVNLGNFDLQSLQTLLKAGYSFAFALFIGCFTVGSFLSITTYFFSLRLLLKLRASSRKKQLKKLNRDCRINIKSL